MLDRERHCTNCFARANACYEFVADLLRGSYGETGVMDFGLKQLMLSVINVTASDRTDNNLSEIALTLLIHT